jgi:hypothetical protein
MVSGLSTLTRYLKRQKEREEARASSKALW